MRYKTLRFLMTKDAYDVGSISDIEIVAVISNNYNPKNNENLWACVPEDHPAFNIDLWCNKIDFIEHQASMSRFAYGGDDVVDFIKANFPHIVEYYSKQI